MYQSIHLRRLVHNSLRLSPMYCVSRVTYEGRGLVRFCVSMEGVSEACLN
jgi:hypothetical protein